MRTAEQVVHEGGRAPLGPKVPRELRDPGHNVDRTGVEEIIWCVGEGGGGHDKKRHLRNIQGLRYVAGGVYG